MSGFQNINDLKKAASKEYSLDRQVGVMVKRNTGFSPNIFSQIIIFEFVKSIKLIIHGHVHGVFYRQSTMEKANAFGIKGTVRNCDDGTVEIIAEGPEENLNKLIAWCHKGPPRAKVTHIDIHEQPLKNYTGFTISR